MIVCKYDNMTVVDVVSVRCPKHPPPCISAPRRCNDSWTPSAYPLNLLLLHSLFTLLSHYKWPFICSWMNYIFHNAVCNRQQCASTLGVYGIDAPSCQNLFYCVFNGLQSSVSTKSLRPPIYVPFFLLVVNVLRTIMMSLRNPA